MKYRKLQEEYFKRPEIMLKF